MAITAARQRTGVSEGFALGLCMLERYEFGASKLRLDLAFEQAWRDWPYKAQFPQVDTDLRNGTDAVWVMSHAGRGHATVTFYWEWDGGPFTIRSRDDDWDSDNESDVERALRNIGGTVPLEGWVTLAKSFVQDLDE